MADPTDLDDLMSLDPLSLSKDPTALAQIIQYHRNHRAKAAETKATGGRSARVAGDAPKLDAAKLLASITGGTAKPVDSIKRRI